MKKVVFSLAVVLTLGIISMIGSGFRISGPDKETLRLTGGVTLTASLDGEQETTTGDPDGSGWFEVTLNQGQGTIEYTLVVENIVPASAAHIHIGAVGVAGPVVIGLSAPTNGMSSGTIEVDPELIKTIRKNPSAYYVNVHNSTYPAGAIRGQLSK